ncbi:MAG: tRNA 2-thiouridine(34) synthase MnmA [Clostridiales bacterium]|nr:tRNA 2-thiouridine(34) synthase MnmA [Clostridiales bacterium]
MKKVVLGLSGGVDSAVSALLLKKQGYDVTGVFLDMGTGDLEGARAVADEIGIDFQTVNIEKKLSNLVMEPFIDAYLGGLTPNPCILCNPKVKFPALIKAADEIGAEYAATGHYALVDYDSTSGMYRLLASPGDNDQSYMLSRLDQRILSRLILPLGSYSKSDVRKIAWENRLSVASKPDSMEICFIPDGDYAAFIEKHRQIPPEGDFVDIHGNVLGRHKGIHRYTQGQRRGLGVAAGKRMFVLKIEPETNRVVLSDAEDLAVSEIHVNNLIWVSIKPPETAIDVDIKVRHTKLLYAGKVIPGARDTARVIFDTPVRMPAAGQTAAFYRDNVMLGSGIILRRESI